MSTGTERPASPRQESDHRAPRPQRHASYVWAFIAFLVANMLSGRTDQLPVQLPVGPDRMFLALAVLLVLLDPRVALRTIRWRAAHVVAACVIGFAALSAYWAGTLTTSLGFFAIVDRLVVPYGVFVLAPVVFARREDRLLLLKTMTVLGVYLGITAVGEVIGPSQIVFPRYILDRSVGIQFGRARGPFVASEANGLVMLASLWCALLLDRQVDSRRWRAFARVAVLVAAVGSMLTLTRSIWLGLVLGVVAVALADRTFRRRVLIGAAVVGVVGGAIYLGSAEIRERATGRANDQSSVYDRQNTNAAALRAIADHPLTGIGWVRFISESGDYVRQDPDYPITVTTIEVHNVVLSRTAELGLVGGGLWAASVALGLGLAVVRRPQDADEHGWRVVLLGSGTAWAIAVMSSPAPYPLPNTLVWLFAALAARSYLTWPAPDGERNA